MILNPMCSCFQKRRIWFLFLRSCPDGSFEMNGTDYVYDEKDSEMFTIRYYRPRIEGLFARIERWMAKDSSEIKWKVTTRDNITTLFGWNADSRISNPQHPDRIFEWLPEFVFDDKGNCSRYVYKPEDEAGVERCRPP